MTDSPEESGPSNVKARLKELLDDIALFIDRASEEDRRRLLSTLEKSARSDRRKHLRKPCSFEVTLATWRVFTESIRDISVGGVFVETSEAFSVGQHVKLMFSPPGGGEPVEINGQVVRILKDGIGVKFTSASKDVEKALAGL